MRIIIASGHPRPEFDQEYYRLGVCDYFIKPFEVPDLLASIERNLATKQTMLGPLAAERAELPCPDLPYPRAYDYP